MFDNNVEIKKLVVESKHPYSPGTIDKTVTIPGAVAIGVAFDPRCHSYVNDVVKISQSSSSSANPNTNVGPIWSLSVSGPAPKTSSSPSKWPRKLLRRPGSALALSLSFSHLLVL